MMIERAPQVEVKPTDVVVKGSSSKMQVAVAGDMPVVPPAVAAVAAGLGRLVKASIRATYPSSDPRDPPLVGTALEFDNLEAADWPEVKITPTLTLTLGQGRATWHIHLSVVAYCPCRMRWGHILEMLDSADIVTSQQLATESIDQLDGQHPDEPLAHVVLRPEVGVTGTSNGIGVTILMRTADRLLMLMSEPKVRAASMAAVQMHDGLYRIEESFDEADWQVFYPPEPAEQDEVMAAFQDVIENPTITEWTPATRPDDDDDEGDHLPDFSMN
jgi:hypothetical protein